MPSLKKLSKFIPEAFVPAKVRLICQFLYGALFQYGWLNSLRHEKPVDRQGNPLPWFSYPCIDFLQQLDLRDKEIFEWGAGHSTFFWSIRAKRVVSIENNPTWYNYLKTRLPPNCELIASKPENEFYVTTIDAYPEQFDIIVIDGTDYGRPPSSAIARQHLKKGGFVVLDNSDQCLQSAKILRDADFIQVDFTGFCPGGGYAQTTSIFFDREYSFRTIDGIQPHPSPAQPNPPWPSA
jgi:hypothetical protein